MLLPLALAALGASSVTLADQFLVYQRTGPTSGTSQCGGDVQALLPVGPTALCLTAGTITRFPDLDAPLVSNGQSWSVDCANNIVNVYSNPTCSGGSPTPRSMSCINGISFTCVDLAWDKVITYSDQNCKVPTPSNDFTVAYDFCQTWKNASNPEYYYAETSKIMVGPLPTAKMNTYGNNMCTYGSTDTIASLTINSDCHWSLWENPSGFSYSAVAGGVKATSKPTSAAPTTLSPTTPTSPSPTTILECRTCYAGGDPHINYGTCLNVPANLSNSTHFDCQFQGTTTFAVGSTWSIQIKADGVGWWTAKYASQPSTISEFTLVDTAQNGGGAWTFTAENFYGTLEYLYSHQPVNYGPFQMKIETLGRCIQIDHYEFVLHVCQSYFQDPKGDGSYILSLTLTTADLRDGGLCQGSCPVPISNYQIVPVNSRRRRARELLDYHNLNFTVQSDGSQLWYVREHQSCLNSGLTGQFLEWCHVDVGITQDVNMVQHHIQWSNITAQHAAIAKQWFSTGSPARPSFLAAVVSSANTIALFGWMNVVVVVFVMWMGV